MLRRPVGGARLICVQSYAQLTGNVSDLELLYSFLQERGIKLWSRRDAFLPSQAFPTIDTWWMQLTIWLPYLYWYAPSSCELAEFLAEIRTNEGWTPKEAQETGEVGHRG